MMKLRFLTKLVFAVVLIGFVASCIGEDYEEYVPPTYEDEMALLSEYLDTISNRGYDVDTTDLGVYYLIDSVGTGDFPVFGDTCVVKYTGMFMDGVVFDASGSNTFEVILGETSVIEGWTDGLQVFNKDAEGLLIIPSNLGYGTGGYYSIPPNTTLIFSIEMVDIKQGY